MNSITRQDVLTKLFNSSEYLELQTNRSRIEFIFKNVMDYRQLKAAVQENVLQSKMKNGKSFSMAQNFKIEGDLYLELAGTGPPKQQQENLERALKAYKRALVYVPAFEEVKMAAKLYARKCQIHLYQNEHEAALYSIDMAIDILNAYVLGRDENHVRIEIDVAPEQLLFPFQILKVNCLKLSRDYQEAKNLLQKMLLAAEDDREPESSRISQEQKDNVNKMLGEIECLLESIYPGESCYPTIYEILQDDCPKLEYFNYCFDPRCKIEQLPVVGRHFIAQEDIPADTIILQEKPYSIIIESDYLHRKCSFCFEDLSYKFFPCLHCKELAFCDRNCFEQAYKIFHQFECGIISILRSTTSPCFHVFRMVSKIGPLNAYQAEQTKHEYSIDDYLNEPNQRTVPESGKTIEEKIRAYKMSSILWDHDSKHSNYSNVHHIVLGIELVILLDLTHQMALEDDYDFLMNFTQMIILDIRRIIFNVFGWHEYNSDWTLRGHVANCQCLVGSLINHSCVSNTNWEVKKGQIKFTTKRLIKKGEEITITYGPNKDMAYARRQERLNHYFFACHCSACVKDASQGQALKCPMIKQNQCQNGLVPFETALDLEPTLYGQCLLCFEKYPDFKANIQEYRRCLKHLQEISMIAPLNQNPVLFQQARDLCEKFCQLSVPGPNPNVHKALMLFTNIIKHSATQPKDLIVELAINLIDTFLPQQMAADDFETLENLFYWHDIIQDYIDTKYRLSIEFHPSIDSIEIMDGDYYRSWECLFNFKKRIDCILDSFENVKTTTIVGGMVKHLQQRLHSKEFLNQILSQDDGTSSDDGGKSLM